MMLWVWRLVVNVHCVVYILIKTKATVRTARTCAAAEQQYSKVVDLLLMCCVEGVHTALAVVEHNGLREKQFLCLINCSSQLGVLQQCGL